MGLIPLVTGRRLICNARPRRAARITIRQVLPFRQRGGCAPYPRNLPNGISQPNGRAFRDFLKFPATRIRFFVAARVPRAAYYEFAGSPVLPNETAVSSPAPESLDSPFDWNACIQAARAGSEAALGRLLEAFRPLLLGIAERELDGDLRAKISPSDLVQETFLGGFPAFPRFVGETEEELRAWLCRILHNRLADVRDRYQQTAKRQVSREQPLDPAAVDGQPPLANDTPSPSSHARRREDAERLEAALAQLSEEHRQVIHLRHREHKSFAEAAQTMNRSQDAVQKLWVRAIQKLREILGSEEP